jgi:peptidoglycan/LPS O-acetylase OafA/YrhL
MTRFRRKLPAGITIALWLVLITTAWSLIRLWTSMVWWGVLTHYAPQPGPLYVGASGAAWAVAGLALTWGFWRRRGWTPAALLASALGFAAWLWADRLLVQYRVGANWPFSLVVTLVVLGFITVVVLDPRNRLYFGKEADERESQARPTS